MSQGHLLVSGKTKICFKGASVDSVEDSHKEKFHTEKKFSAYPEFYNE